MAKGTNFGCQNWFGWTDFGSKICPAGPPLANFSAKIGPAGPILGGLIFGVTGPLKHCKQHLKGQCWHAIWNHTMHTTKGTQRQLTAFSTWTYYSKQYPQQRLLSITYDNNANYPAGWLDVMKLLHVWLIGLNIFGNMRAQVPNNSLSFVNKLIAVRGDNA